MTTTSTALKVSVDRARLAEQIKLVQEAAASRSTLPILAYFRLMVGDGLLKLAATNLEIGIEREIQAAVVAPGATAVSVRTFSDFINSLVGESVTLTLNEKTETLKIECGRFNANLKCLPASEFPEFYPPKTDGGFVTQVDAKVLAGAIDQVAFAVASDEARPVLTGVHVGLAENETRLDAADGFRLSVRKMPGAQCKPVNVIVPAKSLHALRKSLSKDTPAITITVNANRDKMIFEVPGTRVVSTLIDGNYPDTNRIVPSVVNTRLVLAREELLSTVLAIDVFSDSSKDRGKTVRFALLKEANGDATMVVSAESAETGGGVAALPVTLDRGEGFDVHLQAKYVADALKCLDTPQVAFECLYSGPGSANPVAIRGVGLNEYTHVIMPMSVKSAAPAAPAPAPAADAATVTIPAPAAPTPAA